MANSPCDNCTRVKQPKYCGNKNCLDWREWFIRQWDGMRKDNPAPKEKEEEDV